MTHASGREPGDDELEGMSAEAMGRVDSDPIDAFIDEAERIRAESYAAFVDFANAQTFAHPVPLPDDPFSSDYRNAVLASYYKIAALAEYRAKDHESAQFGDVEAPLLRQWPFISGDPAFIGRYYMSIGLMIASIALPVGSYILEYGSGWGHVASALGNAGYEVACVDIDPAFVELVNRRSSVDGTKVRAYVGEFGERPDGDRPLDAVYFLEAFHHSLDHLAVLQRIAADLRSGGKLVFGAEPIYAGYDVPWGVRRDGHAVWAIRKFKWMELGFSEDYFIRLLLRCGFLVRKTQIDFIGPLGLYYIAEKVSATFALHETLLPADERATMAAADRLLSVADLAGWTHVDVEFRNAADVPIEVAISLGSAHAERTIDAGSVTQLSVAMTPSAGPLHVRVNSTLAADVTVTSVSYQ